MRRFIFVLIATLSLVSAAFPVEPDEVLPDQALEARARALSKTLRCMVCQNQSIDDSNAPLARDLRLLLRERIKSGSSDNEVRDFLVSRYGEFVLLEPRLNRHTFILWALPALGLVIGGIALLLALRRGKGIAANPLSVEEKQRLKRLLEGPDVKKM
ncbi:MAG TPA: cytochrome c-type biogenesis protein [Xanthobacteraceae bacterium]